MRRESPFSDACSSAWALPSAAPPTVTRKLAPGHQDQLSLVALVDLGDQAPVFQLLPVELLAQSTDLVLHPRYLALEIDDFPHAGEVHPHLLGQPLYIAPKIHVLLRVEPGVLYALARPEQALLLVHSQRLRMHPDKL